MNHAIWTQPHSKSETKTGSDVLLRKPKIRKLTRCNCPNVKHLRVVRKRGIKLGKRANCLLADCRSETTKSTSAYSSKPRLPPDNIYKSPIAPKIIAVPLGWLENAKFLSEPNLSNRMSYRMHATQNPFKNHKWHYAALHKFADNLKMRGVDWYYIPEE